MTAHNPMRDPAVIQKMINTKRTNGTLIPKKPWQGGNGRGPTKAQTLLHQTIGGLLEFPVSLGVRKPGYPTHYKIDLALPEIRLAIEIDGATHNKPEQQQRDQKKTEALSALGWTILRLSNKEISTDLKNVATSIYKMIQSLRSSTT
jgi:hypothetical protein